MPHPTQRRLPVALLLAVGLVCLALPACGGGGAAGGRGLALLSFSQDSVDNVFINTRLRFEFSEGVDPATVSNASFQIREGDAFGRTVPGLFITEGSTVLFEPALAARCDHSDSGLKPDTQYRIQIIGFPEEFSVRTMSGQQLGSTQTYEFHTRLDTDPQLYADAVPGVGPTVVSVSPADGAAAVPVVPGNHIAIELSENVEPCSINDDTVQVWMYESGNPAQMTPVPGSSPVRYSGFDKGGSIVDQTPSDPFTWGADSTVSYAAAPRRILCDLQLVQDFGACRLIVSPLQGFNPNPAQNASLFPENALIVVLLSFEIEDYGGLPLTPTTIAFTTENTAATTATYTVANDGETNYDDGLTTAALDPDPRAPSRVQAYMLFSGDGDNGSDPFRPTLPENVLTGCVGDLQTNDGTLDDFDATSDVLFDTGAVQNTCANTTDGSFAVVWEFRSFTIRNGATVRFVGVNPAVILVQGDVRIESGGRLSVTGDNQGGSPRGDGQNGWNWTSSSTATRLGGTGVAGGGDGGDTIKHGSGNYGKDGFAAYGSADGQGAEGGEGSGLGGVGHNSTYPGPDYGDAQGGGGGGHAEPGGTSTNLTGPASTPKSAARGAGGALIGTDRLLQPSAGGGGGGGGNDQWSGSYTSYGTGSGSGGAGGGFVDITSSGDIVIDGILDASGGRGGDPGNPYTGTNTSSGGGGGGGAGGGIRLLTPNAIILGGASVVSAAGGPGGVAPSLVQPTNGGGAGSNGRIVMEDGDSVIAGLGAAAVTPGEGDAGFFRGIFDPSRFQGGGLTPKAVSELIAIGSYAGFDPMYLNPTAADFKVGIPVATSPGPANTALFIEARGYQMLPDGMPDTASRTSWVSIGYFRDSGVETAPSWFPGHPGDIVIPADNTGGPGGFNELNGLGAGGHEFLQLRITMVLPPTVGPFDAGAYLDDWTIRFTHDQ